MANLYSETTRLEDLTVGDFEGMSKEEISSVLSGITRRKSTTIENCINTNGITGNNNH